ncbi:hypothetical protein, partial [Neisseria sp. HMSC056A03]|uniref:hypothetical protein n=1 Tax=Neisseria sp. HMSC056A03 TaxID=1739544 RepID=UPI0009F6F0A6
FGRLCVETFCVSIKSLALTQPPSGGCVLKLFHFDSVYFDCSQPPSGGCVLKPQARNALFLV